MLRGKHIQEVWRWVGNPKQEVFDVPTAEELIQKP
jgi:hypothetical protein